MPINREALGNALHHAEVLSAILERSMEHDLHSQAEALRLALRAQLAERERTSAATWNLPAEGDRAVCASCGMPIRFVGPYWAHIGDAQPRHPAQPTTSP